MKTIIKLFHKFKIIQETSSEIDWYQVVKVRISHTRAGSKTSRGLPSSGEFVSGTKFDNYLRTRFCRHIWRVLSFFRAKCLKNTGFVRSHLVDRKLMMGKSALICPCIASRSS